MLEERFAENRVKTLQRVARLTCQRLIFYHDKTLCLLAEKRFPERVERIPDQSIARCQPVDPCVDGTAGIETKHAGQFESIPSHQTFNRVHDPGYIANAADNPCLREQLNQGWQLGTPHAIGVEDQPVVMN